MEPAFPFHYGARASPSPGFFALVLVEAGALRVKWSSGARVLPPGSLLFVPPSAGTLMARRTDTTLSGCEFGRSLVDPLSIGSAMESIVGMLATEAPLAARLASQAFAEARTIFAQLAREAEGRRAGFEAMVRLKLMEALLILSRGLSPSAVIAPDTPARHHPDDAMRYIQEHYADQLSPAQIAELFGHNPSYFSRLFHQRAGMTLVEFINRIRIQKSCQLLKRSDAGITEIALAVGYNNISHFNRFFRRLMGMTPREYRVQSRK
jgi:AraC-like DNA-binding protein